MISIAKKIESIFESGRRFIKGVVRGQNDTQTASEVSPFGIDSIPPDGYRAIFMQTEDQSEKVVVGYINLAQLEGLVKGESRLYSTDPDGALSIAIYMRGDGTMEVGGDADFMVRFSAMEAAFNEFRDDFNAALADINQNSADIAAFAAAYVPGGPAAVGLPPTFTYGDNQPADSAADISGAKIDEIKTL